MTLDQVIDQSKNDFITYETSRILGLLVSKYVFFSLPLINPLAGWVIGLVLIQVAEKFDWVSFHIYRSIKNNLEANQYEDAVRETLKVTESGDDYEIKKARDAQLTSFIKLWTL